MFDNTKKAFQAQIAHQLQMGFINWFNGNFGQLDLDDDQKMDFDEIKENALVIIHEGQHLYGANDPRMITSGAAAVWQGLRTIQAAIHIDQLLQSLHLIQGALQEITKLIQLYIDYQSKKHGVEVTDKVAPPATPGDKTKKGKK